MQIKVEHIKTIKTDNMVGEGPAELLVAEAKLVLVECKPEEGLIALHSEKYHLYNFLEEHKEFLWIQEARFFKPILISETEKIEVGDWVYSEFFGLVNVRAMEEPIATDQNYGSGKIVFVNSTGKEGPCSRLAEIIFKKILALPEHFSIEILQKNVDGKLVDGDKVLVECEIYQDTINYHKDIWANFHKIKLNSSNYITLHKIEEKMYTRDEVINYSFDFYYYMSGAMNVPFNLISENRDNAKEWFEQNVK